MAYTQEDQQTFQFHNFPPSFVFFWLLRLVLATAEHAPHPHVALFLLVAVVNPSNIKIKLSLIQIFDLVKILCWTPFMTAIRACVLVDGLVSSFYAQKKKNNY